MELSLSNTLLTGDHTIDHIVGEVKSQGIFDQFRKECIADVDTKPAYQNLRTRVEGSVNSFLNKLTWKPDLNKNQLRETLRKHIHDAPYLDAGVERIVDQVVNPKVFSVFMPQIEDVVYKFLGIERPKVKEKNGACGLKDLLPKDLDPVSPESDKNSLKDLSLESIEASGNLDDKQDEKAYDKYKMQEEEIFLERDKTTSENGHVSSEEKASDESARILNKTGSSTNLNVSGKSDDKMDEEEEDSPTFEPIDIMNLNESNISNDSHLSGISELTSHRSRSPDLSNELSRDNFDYSNQDSQLSKVSSDSRLSIVTDFGSSNHGLTPVHDIKDETTRDKYEAKINKDDFRAIRELDSSKNKSITKNSFEFVKNKDTQDYKDSKDIKSTKSLSSRESSRDATDSIVAKDVAKDKYEHKSSREKNRDSESIKSRNTREKSSSRDTKYYKDRDNDRKKTSGNAKYDKYSKSKDSKLKDKIDQVRENSEKSKDTSDNLKDNAGKLKDEKLKEIDKKDNMSNEAKDLKDLYKEKIRELREKKELTEKEKLNKERLNKETTDRKDSSKDRKSSKKEHRSSSSSSSSSRNLLVNCNESKSSKISIEKVIDSKDKKLDTKDKTTGGEGKRREEKRLSKDSKSKSHFSSKTDLSDRSDRSDLKKISRSEKEDKITRMDIRKDIKGNNEKTNSKKDTKGYLQSKSSDRNERVDSRKDARDDNQSKDKDKKRREDKRSKVKDDHSSLRKSSNDRRSTDRDGSNGSNSKTSQSNNANSNVTSQKSNSSNLTKENQVSNSSSETSDSIEETQSSHQSHHSLPCKLISSQLSTSDKNHTKIEASLSETIDKSQKQQEIDPNQMNLPAKKRSLLDEEQSSAFNEIKIKKPKFAKNMHEAKKLMKVRKQIEKQKVKDEKRTEARVAQDIEQINQLSTIKDAENLASMPDDERVQIIEVPDEEYEEPYPESSLMLDERSIIMLGTESCTRNLLNSHRDQKETLSNMELCIRESLNEIVSNKQLDTTVTQDFKSLEEGKQLENIDDSERQSSSCAISLEASTENMEDPRTISEECKDDSEVSSKDEISKENPFTVTESSLKTEKTYDEEKAASKRPESVVPNENETRERSTEKNAEILDHDRIEIQNDDKKASDKKQIEIRDNDEAESHHEQRVDTASWYDDCAGIRLSSSVNEDDEECRYFYADNERSERFSSFLESLEMMEITSLEDIVESLGGKIVTSLPKSMAPPLSKLKRSSSPLSDILVNNSNNNNNGHKQSSPNEDTTVHNVKRKKLLKKPRFPSFCSAQGISNGENFVMPLSPDSDVSATSEKTTSSHVIKEEKGRNRSNQRYSSDDLYKPRPLFSSSSRRSRRSNQA